MRLVLALMLFLVSMSVHANMQCGFKPFKPVGCFSGDYICMCDDNGCRWVLVGC